MYRVWLTTLGYSVIKKSCHNRSEAMKYANKLRKNIILGSVWIKKYKSNIKKGNK